MIPNARTWRKPRFSVALAGVSSFLLSGCAGSPVNESDSLPRSEGAISQVCRRDPSRFPTTRYFPDHEFKMALAVGASADRDGIEKQVAPYRCYFTGILAAYDESPLTPADEAYRLIWDRSFHAPVVVRIEKHGDRYRATITRDASDGNGIATLVSRTIDIGADVFRSVQQKVEKAGCWNSDHDCSGAQADPRSRNHDPYTSILVLDGTDWMLEGARGKEHWAVYVDAPGPGAFRDAGAAVARAAGLDVDKAE